MNDDVKAARDLRVAFTDNDPRARHLLTALEAECDDVADVPFDRIDRVTKLLAGSLSFRPNRAEWWNMYQMHPLVERRRSRVLTRGLAEQRPIDGLIMWGSWFHPWLSAPAIKTPFVHYIDQSLAPEPVLGETHPGYVDRRLAHARQARTYRDAAAVLCMSDWARQQTMLAHPALPASKVQAVGWGPCGVDLSAETPNWDTREPVVLHVSNDFHRKGLDFLVETSRRVRATLPGAKFVVIGQDYGGMKDVPQAEGVIFTGRINDRAQLQNYFRKASVFFLPHRFDRSPHVLVEAMSAGLPIVTSAQGGPIELTDGTGAGVALPIGDIDGYATALLEVLQNPAQAAAMGGAGWELMRRKYTWRAVAREILEALRSHVVEPAPIGRALVS